MNALSPIRLPEGIHLNVPEAAYHADPAPTPSASAGVLKTLATRSPLHAWHKHPRLNPEYSGGNRSDAMDTGTILHALICGTPLPYDVEAFPDYRTNAAKEWRDGVISSGRIPILAHKIEPIYDVARGVRANIERMPEIAAAIESADKEATLIWRERISWSTLRKRVSSTLKGSRICCGSSAGRKTCWVGSSSPDRTATA